MNIFEGVLHNWLFIAISTIMIGGQVLIVFVGGQAFSVASLTGVQWAISLVLGLLSLPVGVLIRLIPDAPLEAMYRAVVVRGLLKVSSEVWLALKKPYLSYRRGRSEA